MMVTDCNGHGRPVAFALISSECKDYLRFVFTKFMESNPAVKSGLLNVVIDKDFKENSALQETFPADVKIKICLFHAIQAQREVSSDSYNLNKDLRKKLKDFFSMLANSKNEDEYNLYYSEFCNILNSSEEGKLFLNY
jgi:hypothetical protein